MSFPKVQVDWSDGEQMTDGNAWIRMSTHLPITVLGRRDLSVIYVGRQHNSVNASDGSDQRAEPDAARTHEDGRCTAAVGRYHVNAKINDFCGFNVRTR